MGVLLIAVVILGFWLHRRKKAAYQRMLEQANASTSGMSNEGHKEQFAKGKMTPVVAVTPVQHNHMHVEMGELDAQGRPHGRYELQSSR